MRASLLCPILASPILASLTLAAPALAQEHSGQAAPATQEGPAELSGDVLFLVDVSGSMALGQRYPQAAGEVRRLAAGLTDADRFDLVFFDVEARPAWERYMRARERMQRRLGETLAETAPDLRTGTNLEVALDHALERRPDHVVVFTDAVVTRGELDLDALDRALDRASRRGVHLHFALVQDGEFVDPQVEDKPAARELAEYLAHRGGGQAWALEPERRAPTTFRRPRPAGGGVEVELVTAQNLERIVGRELRPYPRFRISVRDPVLLAGEELDVWEYGGVAWLDVIIRDRESGAEIDRLEGVRLVRDGRRLYSAYGYELVDASLGSRREQNNQGLYRLQAMPGAIIDVVYNRGARRFLEQRFIAEEPETVIVAPGAVQRPGTDRRQRQPQPLPGGSTPTPSGSSAPPIVGSPERLQPPPIPAPPACD